MSVLRPLNDIVIVRRTSGAVAPSGLVQRLKPFKSPDGYGEGVVVAAGPGRVDRKGRLVPVTVRPGERVMFARYATTRERVFDGEPLVFARSSEVMVVREGE